MPNYQTYIHTGLQTHRVTAMIITDTIKKLMGGLKKTSFGRQFSARSKCLRIFIFIYHIDVFRQNKKCRRPKLLFVKVQKKKNHSK